VVFKSIEGGKVYYPDWRKDWRYPYKWEQAEAAEFKDNKYYILHEPTEGEFLPVQIREFFKEIKPLHFFTPQTFERIGRAYGLNGERLSMLFEGWCESGLIKENNGLFSFFKTFQKNMAKLANEAEA